MVTHKVPLDLTPPTRPVNWIYNDIFQYRNTLRSTASLLPNAGKSHQSYIGPAARIRLERLKSHLFQFLRSLSHFYSMVKSNVMHSFSSTNYKVLLYLSIVFVSMIGDTFGLFLHVRYMKVRVYT